MKIELNNGGKWFSLSILEYEFQTSSMNEDLGWLEINIQVCDGSNTWTSRGPYLTTVELVKMHNWFGEINHGVVDDKHLSFTEHELAFKYYPHENAVGVILDYNFHPKGENYNYESDREIEVMFDINPKLILNVLKSLDVLIQRYPTRTNC